MTLIVRGPLYRTGYRPLFSGHQTFPLRYGWLKKVYDAIATSAGSAGNKHAVFLADDAIARFGAGKNMVASMRHWAQRAWIIEEVDEDWIRPTAIGDLIFGSRGVLDPYMEVASTSWLVHWVLAGTPTKTTWFWVFNHYNGTTFRRDDLVSGIVKLVTACNWQRVAETTIRRDVDCFIRTYVAPTSGAGAVEDNLESPLAELSLIRLIGRRDDYQFVRGPKPSLTAGVFILALNEFWKSVNATRTLSFEMVAHEPGSPGRVFLLDEADLAGRLGGLEDLTNGIFRWSETAGLRQVTRERELTTDEVLQFLASDYGRASALEAA